MTPARLAALIGALVLIAGLVTFLWSFFGLSGRAGVSLDSKVSVLDAGGAPLANRLAVVFLKGQEIGRTDASGSLRGQFPPVARTVIGSQVTLREGEVQILSFPPEDQLLIYAFPGDSLNLPFEVRSCRLALTADGKIICPDESAEVPPIAVGLMALLLGFLLFPIATLAVRRVVPWPGEVYTPLRYAAGYLAGGALAALVVVMFVSTGVVNQWVFQLTALFSGAVNVIVGALAVSVGYILFFTKARAYFVPPK